MITEITCPSKPLTVIPMVVSEVQDAIAGGQLRPTDQLIDVQRCGIVREESTHDAL